MMLTLELGHTQRGRSLEALTCLFRVAREEAVADNTVHLVGQSSDFTDGGRTRLL
jgi:hypothetical protein